MRRAPRRTNAVHSSGIASAIRIHPHPPLPRASPSVSRFSSSAASASSSSDVAASLASGTAGAARASAPAAAKALERAPPSCGPALGAARGVASSGLAVTAAENAAAAAAASAVDAAVGERGRGCSCRSPLAPAVVFGALTVRAVAADAPSADSAGAIVTTTAGAARGQMRRDLKELTRLRVGGVVERGDSRESPVPGANEARGTASDAAAAPAGDEAAVVARIGNGGEAAGVR